jgi:putative transposase
VKSLDYGIVSQKDVLNTKDIAKLYGARWDIELLFKELKSKYALDVLETKNVQVIEALIWTAIDVNR